MIELERCRLYTFIDTAYLQGRNVEDLARQLCDGGSDLIQLRAKEMPALQLLRIAQRVAPIVSAAGVGLVINDFPELAARVGAPFCHLGQEDFLGYSHVGEVRARVAPALEQSPERGGSARLRIGLSTHAPAQAEKAIAVGADYIAIGPVFATGTKPTAQPVSLQYVRWAAANVRLPWFAIGGINLGNLDSVLEAGARRICAVSAILQAQDVVEACQRFKERILSAARTQNE